MPALSYVIRIVHVANAGAFCSQRVVPSSSRRRAATRTCEYVGESREVEQRWSRVCGVAESELWMAGDRVRARVEVERRGAAVAALGVIAKVWVWVWNWEYVEVIKKRKGRRKYSDFIFRGCGGCWLYRQDNNDNGGGREKNRIKKRKSQTDLSCP